LPLGYSCPAPGRFGVEKEYELPRSEKEKFNGTAEEATRLDPSNVGEINGVVVDGLNVPPILLYVTAEDKLKLKFAIRLSSHRMQFLWKCY
jgi:hypothetical protein